MLRRRKASIKYFICLQMDVDNLIKCNYSLTKVNLLCIHPYTEYRILFLNKWDYTGL